jgi:hypothetical protein
MTRLIWPQKPAKLFIFIAINLSSPAREFGPHLASGVNIGSVGGSLAAWPKPGEQRFC